MQRGGRAARTGRRVIAQKWGLFGEGPLRVSVLVGWPGGGGYTVVRVVCFGTVRTGYVPRLVPSIPSTATHSLPRYRLTATSPSADRRPCSECPNAPEAAQGPAIVASQTCSSRGEASRRVTSLISIEEQQQGTPTILSILSRASPTLAISRADSSCIMQHMALTSHGLHVISVSAQSSQHGTPPLAAPVGSVVGSLLAFRFRRMSFLARFHSVGQSLERGPA